MDAVDGLSCVADDGNVHASQKITIGVNSVTATNNFEKAQLLVAILTVQNSFRWTYVREELKGVLWHSKQGKGLEAPRTYHRTCKKQASSLPEGQLGRQLSWLVAGVGF
jgi:hypothetical protein